MSCLTDNPRSRTVAQLAILFSNHMRDFPFKDQKQATTVLAAVIAATIAARDNPQEDIAEIEEYIEERVAVLYKLKQEVKGVK